MSTITDMSIYEQRVRSHPDAADNLARWLVGNYHGAQDVGQEACLRAFKYAGSFRGEPPNPRDFPANDGVIQIAAWEQYHN